MLPIFLAASINDWNQTYCNTVVPDGVVPPSSGVTLMFSCRNYTSTDLSRFVLHVSAGRGFLDPLFICAVLFITS